MGFSDGHCLTAIYRLWDSALENKVPRVLRRYILLFFGARGGLWPIVLIGNPVSSQIRQHAVPSFVRDLQTNPFRPGRNHTQGIRLRSVSSGVHKQWNQSCGRESRDDLAMNNCCTWNFVYWHLPGTPSGSEGPINVYSADLSRENVRTGFRPVIAHHLSGADCRHMLCVGSAERCHPEKPFTGGMK